jgi:CheY-specific phosphatase CheX
MDDSTIIKASRFFSNGTAYEVIKVQVLKIKTREVPANKIEKRYEMLIGVNGDVPTTSISFSEEEAKKLAVELLK